MRVRRALPSPDWRPIEKSAGASPPDLVVEVALAAAEGAPWGAPVEVALAARLAALLPAHRTYVEPFAGASTVLFAKQRTEREVLGDVAEEVVFRWKFAQAATDDQIARLGRFDWDASADVVGRVKAMEPRDDVQRFYRARYVEAVRFGEGRWRPSRLEKARARLQGVLLRHGDFAHVLDEFDGEDVAFYLRPPATVNLDRLAGALKALRGRFLLAWDGDEAQARAALKDFRLRAAEVAEPDGGRRRVLLAANYDLPAEGGAKSTSPPATEKGAVPAPSVPEGELQKWDADAAIARLRAWTGVDAKDAPPEAWRRFAAGFAWFDSSKPDAVGSYKLPHHDVVGDQLVLSRAGLFAAAAAVQSARGGVDVPEADLPGVRAHLAAHYRALGARAPWEPAGKAVGDILSFRDGDAGVGVLQTHERLTAAQAKHAPPAGWEPTRLSDQDVAHLTALVGKDVGDAYRRACAGDVAPLDALLRPVSVRKELAGDDVALLARALPIDVHTDLRLKRADDPHWEGGEVATPGDQFGVNDVLLAARGGLVDEGVAVDFGAAPARGALAWLDVGKATAQVFPPGAPGSGDDAWCRFLVRDEFAWRAGAQSETRKEFWFDGRHLRGRWLIVKRDDGAWSLVRPADQVPESATLREQLAGADVRKDLWCPIIKVEEERIVTGIALQPDVVDLQGDVVSAEVIKQAAYDFVANYNKPGDNQTRLGVQHRDFSRSLELVESWLFREEKKYGDRVVRKGSWMVTVRVVDDAAWALVKAGRLRGFSIGGVARVQPISSKQPDTSQRQAA